MLRAAVDGGGGEWVVQGREIRHWLVRPQVGESSLDADWQRVAVPSVNHGHEASGGRLSKTRGRVHHDRGTAPNDKSLSPSQPPSTIYHLWGFQSRQPVRLGRLSYQFQAMPRRHEITSQPASPPK
ncbi:hypothetical protein CKAH01_09841 [Colletotrichum kahawae]|uniref:Uncharacterized protein n=1 Tax=Colletotrichum kahawae TaxID=34407 RepID=A0AAD9Y0R9_COLKA|nr:hypothetical protein CKAH01_09841 [Colletotrichum kahawae]